VRRRRRGLEGKVSIKNSEGGGEWKRKGKGK